MTITNPDRRSSSRETPCSTSATIGQRQIDIILNTVRWCKESGIAVMLDLLLGSPGETQESILRTIELMRFSDPDRVGVAVGVRVYPGTELADQVMKVEGRKGLVGGQDTLEPLFFLEPQVAPFVFPSARWETADH